MQSNCYILIIYSHISYFNGNCSLRLQQKFVAKFFPKFIVGIILNKFFKEKNYSFLFLWNDIVLHNSKFLDQACEKYSKKNQHFDWYIRLFSFFWTEMLSYLISDITTNKIDYVVGNWKITIWLFLGTHKWTYLLFLCLRNLFTVNNYILAFICLF